MVCAPTCDPGTLLGSSFARDVTLRPVAGNTVLSFGKCSLNWLNAKAVLTRLKRARHTWLLLVGDSDTRGMALALLQILAAAGAGGQRLYIAPSQDLVVVLQNDSRTFSDALYLGQLFAD